MKWLLIIMTLSMPNLDTRVPFDEQRQCMIEAVKTLQRLYEDFPDDRLVAYCVETDGKPYEE